jgi:branched-chain amino acid transport system permease protein
MMAAGKELWALVNGPQEVGRSPGFWLGFLLTSLLLIWLPNSISTYQLLNCSYIFGNVLLALGLCLIWGFAGILSLGQGAFLGLGGYVYGIEGINLIKVAGNTNLALLAGICAPIALAAILGYVMFYGRIAGVYVAIMTLVVTLLFETFLGQTAGRQWHIGIAYLGGDNGLGRFSAEIHEPPSLLLGLGGHTIELSGQQVGFYYLTLALVVVCYLGLRILVNSRLGLVLAAIREDPGRVEALGYDVRFWQLAIFCVGAFLAGLSGILYVSWGNFITPAVFGITNNILPVIWVSVGGRKSLTATVISTVGLVWLSQTLAAEGEYAFIILGGLLVIVMLVLPEGVVATIVARASQRRAMREV